MHDSCSGTTQYYFMLNKEDEEQVARNAMVIKSLLECVCFCEKQGLAF